METEPGANEEVKPRDFDFKVFLSRYVGYWYWYAIAMVFAVGLAWSFNWYVNPTFGISAKLLLRDQDNGAKNLLQELNIESSSRNIQNEVEILRSHSLMARTLNELNFEVSYFLVGKFKESEVYTDCPFHVEIVKLDFNAYQGKYFVKIDNSETFTFSYENESGEIKEIKEMFGNTLSTPFGEFALIRRPHFNFDLFNSPDYTRRNYRIKFNSLNELQNHYLGQLKVQLVNNESTILDLYLQDKVPLKAIDFLNKHIEMYLASDIEEKNKSANVTELFIDEQLMQISNDLSTIEENRETYKVERGIINLESESQMVLELVKGTDYELAKLNSRLGVINQLENYVAVNQNISDLAPSAIDIDDPLLIRLVGKLSELQTERERVITTSTENNPRLIPLNAEIELTRHSLLENIRNIKNGMLGMKKNFQAELTRHKSRIENIPQTERELLGIEREFRIRESLYLYLLEKKAELSILQASSESDKRLIDSARVLPGPISPNPRSAYSIAILMGFLVPTFLITLIKRLNNSVTEKEMIEEQTKLPIVGLVGINAKGTRQAVQENPQSAISEAYRSIRTNMKFFTGNLPSPVILITSSISTEGKTFSAINLATIYALSGKQTVLVGLDLRKPALGNDQKSITDGVSTYLSNNSSIQQIIKPSGITPNLDVVYSGPIPPNPGELIAGEKLRHLIESLKQTYDIVILDTPPVGLVSDSLIFAELADCTLFVVRYGVSQKDHLRYIRSLSKEKKFPNPAIIFNAVKTGKWKYSYYSGYGYGAGYGTEVKSSGEKASLFRS